MIRKNLILVASDLNGGPGYITKELTALNKYYDENYLVIPRGNFVDENTRKLIKQNNFLLINGKYATLKLTFKFLKKVLLGNFLSNKKYSFFIISFDNFSNIYCFFLRCLIDVKWIVTLHGFYSPIHKKYKFLNSILFRFPNAITTNTEALNKHISHFYPSIRPKTIYPGIKLNYRKSASTPRTIYLDENKKIKIVHLANFYSKIKSHDISIYLSKILREKGIKHEIHFIGEGLFLNDYKEQVRKFKLEKFIFFHGFLNFRKKFLIIEKNDICIMPSKTEAFGLASLECMSVGLPVLASDVPGQNEIVIDGYNGLLFSLNENYDYYTKLKKMIDNTKLYSKLSHGAIETAKKYSSNKMVNDYYNLLSEV